MHRSVVKGICVAEHRQGTSKRLHRQPVIQAAHAQANSYTGNQLHRQPVTCGSVCLGPGLPVQLVASALAVCITDCLCLPCLYSRNNQLYRQSNQAQASSYTLHRQPVIHAAKAQAISYTGSAGTGNQLHRQAQAEQTQASNYTDAQATSYTGNHLHRQRKQGSQLHRQPVTQATGDIGNQFYRQPVIHAA